MYGGLIQVLDYFDPFHYNIPTMKQIISLPKNTYENLLRKAQLAERVRILLQEEYQFEEFEPTPAQREDLKRAREEYKKGNYITFNELKRELGIKNS